MAMSANTRIRDRSFDRAFVYLPDRWANVFELRICFFFLFSFILIPIEIEDGIFPFARRWIYRSREARKQKGD